MGWGSFTFILNTYWVFSCARQYRNQSRYCEWTYMYIDQYHDALQNCTISGLKLSMDTPKDWMKMHIVWFVSGQMKYLPLV